MQARTQIFNRLVGALDELVTQETTTIRAGDYAAVETIQRRAEPVVSTIAAMGADAADGPARARIAALLARRQYNIDFIESQLAIARDELAAVQESTSRVARIAPVYGRTEISGNHPRFSAAG